MAAFTSLPLVKQVLGAGDTRSSIITVADVQIDLRVVPPANIGAALQYFTGSKEHNGKLRAMAVRQGLKINEYGVFFVGQAGNPGDPILGGRTEEEAYPALGFPRLPPRRAAISVAIERASEQ